MKVLRTILQILKRFTKSILGQALFVAITWQTIMTLMGYTIDVSMEFMNNPDWQEPWQGLLGHTFHWDAGWYYDIIRYHYGDGSTPASPVFYPLYPFAVASVHFLSMGLVGVLAASAIVNTIALWLSITALIYIVEHFTKTRKHGWIAVGLLLTSPAAIFIHMFYSEALLIVTGFWAYLFALRRQWARMAILLAFISAARLPAILFIALCGLEYLSSYRWSIRKALNPKILWFLLAPAGFAAFAAYLWAVRGDALAMFSAYDLNPAWSFHVLNLNIIEPWGRSLKVVVVSLITNNLSFDVVSTHLLTLAAICALIASSLYCLISARKSPGLAPLGVFGVLATIMFSLNNNLVSVHRYALPCLVIYIAAVHFLLRKPAFTPVAYFIMYIGALLQTYLMILFISTYFAG